MQSLIHEKSGNVPLPKLDLFGVPPTQSMVERDIVTEHRPITTIDPNSFIQFDVQSAIDEYIDLEKLHLYLKIQLKSSTTPKTDAEWDDISPSNYLLHSMIKQLDIFIGDTQVSTTSPTYAYRAYIEAQLGFGMDAKKSHLSSALWFNDEYEKDDGPNKNHNKEIKNNKVVDLFGRLHSDLSFQGRSLLGGSKLTIRILFHDPEFYLNSTKFSPKVEFLDAALHVHRSKVSQKVVEAHNAALKVTNAKYPITLSKVKPFTIPKGAFDASIDNIHSGQLPRRIILFFVENSAYNGDYKKNPYNFKHFNINSFAVYLDGTQYPSKAYTPDFDKKLFQTEMSSLFEAIDMKDGDANFEINRSNYANGNTILAFNFAPDLSSGCGSVGHVNPIKFGALRLDLKFSKILDQPITGLVYCEFDKILEIDINRNASIDLF